MCIYLRNVSVVLSLFFLSLDNNNIIISTNRHIFYFYLFWDHNTFFICLIIDLSLNISPQKGNYN